MIICENYKICPYNNNCSHAKAHYLIKDKSANRCIIKKDGVLGVVNGVTIKCYCSRKIIRKRKIEKLNK